MSQPTALEQYMLELTNAERAQAGAQPLAFDDHLDASADSHNAWMIATGTFSHTGQNGSSPTDRMQAAGYSLNGAWSDGENIAWASTRPPSGNQDEVDLLNTNLMNSPGHRANILNGDFRQVGIGVDSGTFQGHDSVFATEDFARSSGGPFLTGVAYDDRNGDKAYDPGEGLSGVTVTAKDTSGKAYQTATLDAGGYQLELPPGTYDVTFSGTGIADKAQTVTIADKNVKLDLVDPAASTSAAGGTATQADAIAAGTAQPADSTTGVAASVAATATDTPSSQPTSAGNGPALAAAAGGNALPTGTGQGSSAGSTSPAGSESQADLAGQQTTPSGGHGRHALAGHAGHHAASQTGSGHGDVFSLASLLDSGAGADRGVITGFGSARDTASGALAASDQAIQPTAASQGTGLADQLTSVLAEQFATLQSRMAADIRSDVAQFENQLAKHGWLSKGELGPRHG